LHISNLNNTDTQQRKHVNNVSVKQGERIELTIRRKNVEIYDIGICSSPK